MHKLLSHIYVVYKCTRGEISVKLIVQGETRRQIFTPIYLYVLLLHFTEALLISSFGEYAYLHFKPSCSF